MATYWLKHYGFVGDEPYLAHHGIQGQKWGVKNGPPYPLSRGKSENHLSLKVLKQQGKIPKNAIGQNVDKWGKSKNTNTLYITGKSGSGKSTAAINLADDNTEIVHLDSYFDNLHGPRNKNLDKWLDKKGSDYRKIQLPKDKININDWGKVVERFENDIDSYGKSLYSSNKKLIVEGVELLDDTIRPDKSWFDDQPVIILNTNSLLSIYRANRRDERRFRIVDLENSRMWNRNIRQFKKSNKNLEHSNIV